MNKPIVLPETGTTLPELIDRAAAGEEIVISRDGKAVAKLIPIGDAPSERSLAEMRDDWRGLRESILASGQPPFTIEEILSLRDEGRR